MPKVKNSGSSGPSRAGSQQGAQGFERTTIFEPQKPIKGMRPSVTPGSLPEGILAQAYNLRFDTGTAQVRNGLSPLATSVPASGLTIKGAWAGYCGTTYTILAAFWDGSKTRVYNLNPSNFAWSELTATSGRNGDTRLATNAPVAFQAISNQSQVPCVVIQDGTDYPIVYTPSLPAVAIHQPITPTNVATYSAQLSFPQYLQVWAAGTYGGKNSLAEFAKSGTFGSSSSATSASPVVITWAGGFNPPTGQIVIQDGTGNQNGIIWQYVQNSAGVGQLTGSVSAYGTQLNTDGAVGYSSIAFADSIPGSAGTGQAANLQLSLPVTIATNDYAEIEFVGGAFAVLNLTTSNQLLMIVSCPLFGIFSQIKIDAYDSLHAHTVNVWNPATSLNQPIYVTAVDPNDANAVMVGFNLSALSSSTSPAATNCIYLRFTWVGTSPPTANYIALFEMIALGGNVPGQPQYGVTWQNSESYTESYGQILTNVSTATVASVGGIQGTGIVIPNSPIVYYDSSITVQDVSATEISHGTDTLRIYRQDYGEVQFTLAASYVVNPWTGSWPTGNAGTLITESDTTLSANKDFSQIMPGAQNVCIPVGSSMCINGTRLYVGGGTVTPSDVWVSESFSFVQFSTIVTFLAINVIDQTSAAQDVFPGETVQALYEMPGGFVGVAPVLVYTNRSTWRLDGVDAYSLNRPTRVNQHGTIAPGSISEHFGDVMWLDPERQVRSIHGGMQALSKFKVDTKLLGSPLPASMSAAVMNDRYYLAYTPEGQTLNTNILIYDTLLGEWTEDNNLVGGAADAAILLQIDDLDVRQIYLFTSAGLVFQYETPGQTTDNGVPIAASLTTAEYQGEYWELITRRKVGLVSDLGTTTLDVQTIWTNLRNGGTDGVINLANQSSGTRSYLLETAVNVNSPGSSVTSGGAGLSFQLMLTGQLAGGFNMYMMNVETQIQSISGAAAG